METNTFTIFSITLPLDSDDVSLSVVDVTYVAFSTLGRHTDFFISLHEMTAANHVIVWINLESAVRIQVTRILADGCTVMITDRSTLIQRTISIRSFAYVLGDSRL